jgi:hypothetical protein
MKHDDLVKIWTLAQMLKVSISFLRKEMDAGRIPYLDTGDDILHSFKAVKIAHTKRAKAEKLSHSPTIIAAFIVAIVTIAGWFINPYINNRINPPQKNVAMPIEIVKKENFSPAVVTYGPNSQVNIYQIPSQPNVNSENKENDVNQPL